MPLTPCPDCGREISDAAPACIHCGLPNPARESATRVAGFCASCGRELSHAEAVRFQGALWCPDDYQTVSQHMGRVATSSEPRFSPGTAALLSFLIPGAGQMYRGKVGAGLLWFVGTVLGYIAFIVPGVILHLFCIFNAASRG